MDTGMQDSGTVLTNTRRRLRARHTALGHLAFVSGFRSEPRPSPLVLDWIGTCQGPRSSGPCGTQITSIGSAKGRCLPCLCHTPRMGPTSRLCLHCPGVTVCVAGCLQQAQSHCAGMASGPHLVTETVDSALGWVGIFLLPTRLAEPVSHVPVLTCEQIQLNRIILLERSPESRPL